jgi:hypothetical protein
MARAAYSEQVGWKRQAAEDPLAAWRIGESRRL